MTAELAISGTATALASLCTTTLFPANGILAIWPDQEPITLTEPALYIAPCPTLLPRGDVLQDSESTLSQHDETPNAPGDSNFRDPFYASNFPLSYALAATTITAYMLVIMLFVTPRSFLDGGIVYLGRRSFTNSSAAGVNIGGRPWLQKLAAVTVAISLTIASADTFKAAEKQYLWGIQNAKVLQQHVMGSIELKVIRIISDTFLWLAQAQTLIRLFPRQREKIIIKWAAFALISLDVVFSSLNSFKYSSNGVTSNERPKSFVHPIPALSYLFQLSLGILYAAWVIYYSFMKKRYAFYHPHMKNICLVAIMSITAVLIPTVFFILDISKPDFAGWGDYVRWVGAAAASVVVWEWVERIEALEREEKKDGILGREVFDGDDILEVDAADFSSVRHRKHHHSSISGGGGGDGRGGGGGQTADRHRNGHIGNGWPRIPGLTDRRHARDLHLTDDQEQQSTSTPAPDTRTHHWPARPAPVATPVSRTDTGSAASTVYAVRFQAPSEATSHTPDPAPPRSSVDLSRNDSASRNHGMSEDTTSSVAPNGHLAFRHPRTGSDVETNASTSRPNRLLALRQAANPLFHRGSAGRATPKGMSREYGESSLTVRARDMSSRWDVRSRFEEFAVNQAERIREKIRPSTDEVPLETFRVDAPPRRGAALQQVLEEEELNSAAMSPAGDDSGPTTSGSSRDRSGDLAQSSASHGAEPVLPPDNPPLWPGVQSRTLYDEDEDNDDGYSYDDDCGSFSRSSSIGTDRLQVGEGNQRSQT